jgi:hypothetical protein
VKAFRYPLGHVWRYVSTVGELMEVLRQFPEDMPVLAEWEGTHHALLDPKVAHDFHAGKEEDSCSVLVFDVESDQYGPTGNAARDAESSAHEMRTAPSFQT